MVTIKLKIYDLLSSIENYINNTIGSNIDVFNTNYHELYIKPKGTELYVKCYKGKKVIYKPVKYFVNINPYNDSLSVITKDNKPNDINVSFDFEIAIEEGSNIND